MNVVSTTQVLLAFALDMLIGDPLWLPHPVRMIGRGIEAGERILRRFCATTRRERSAGMLLALCIVLSTYLLGEGMVVLLKAGSHPLVAGLGYAVLVYLIATTIATRELIGSAHRVIAAIDDGDLENGRRQVSRIVGRDTQDLSEQGVLRAAIETLAENLSDGVVAPLLYLALGGLPLALAYKAVNTLDSMLGYKNEQYRHFGWAAARLDDAANFVPARISGLLIVISVFLYALARNPREAIASARRSCSVMVRDGRNHPSPNSGIPEAAMAGALRIRLGGASTYGGVVSEKPFIGSEHDSDYVTASKTALVLVAISSAIAAGMTAGISALRGML